MSSVEMRVSVAGARPRRRASSARPSGPWMRTSRATAEASSSLGCQVMTIPFW